MFLKRKRSGKAQSGHPFISLPTSLSILALLYKIHITKDNKGFTHKCQLRTVMKKTFQTLCCLNYSCSEDGLTLNTSAS